MAKEQNLSLNSQKISGACGRLMCCLRYEHEAYEEALATLPKVDSIVDTPDGRGTVCEVLPLSGLVKVKFSGEHAVIRSYVKDQIKIVAASKKAAEGKNESS